MTIQTCCGDIVSNDPNVRESDFPYMTRNCYDTSEWSVPECAKNCCGSTDATCNPTREGGYCVRDGSFYKYPSSPTGKNKVNMSRNAAFQESAYQRVPTMDPTFPSTNQYNRARYRDTKRQVILDMQNDQMNTGILQQKKLGDFPRIPEDDYRSIFQTSQTLTVLSGITSVMLSVFVLYVLSTLLKH